MKIKVCGLREKENILALYKAGIQMMGFIFYEKSKRFMDADKEEEILDIMPSDVKKVGVFVNAQKEFILEKIKTFELDYVQLHGEESPDFCTSIASYAKVMKAFRVDEDFDFKETVNYQHCDLLLFDAKGKEYGGNGIKYDWNLLRNYTLATPFLLSGGIGPEDVDKILAFSHPKFVGIDINSGFETAPGLKNIESIQSFTSYLKCTTQ